MTQRSEAYRGFSISWLDPPLNPDRWTSNITTEDASYLRIMSRGATVVNGRTCTEMLARSPQLDRRTH
jgi:hypothetical protein